MKAVKKLMTASLSMLGMGAPKAPDTPAAKVKPTAPVSDDKARQIAAEKRAAKRGGGRSSTMLRDEGSLG